LEHAVWEAVSLPSETSMDLAAIMEASGRFGKYDLDRLTAINSRIIHLRQRMDTLQLISNAEIIGLIVDSISGGRTHTVT